MLLNYSSIVETGIKQRIFRSVKNLRLIMQGYVNS